ncbi:MAG: N-methyl-L-tryptophan oxidase [Thaumarchaeota archaeon]|nr:N-methyl-L-tryptophan oxidase [Nitrososphaerota archaeon]
MQRYDAIVVGAGAMGCATALQLAKRGVKTLVLEKFTLNHPYGSSHGRTRIIRTAYAENPCYVPLVKRAFELWRDVEGRSGRQLLVKTGGLMIGSPKSWLVTGVLRSAKEHGLPHELMSRSEVEARFPQFRMSRSEVAVHEDAAGFLFAEECIRAMKELAEKDGAEFHFEEPVADWEIGDHGIIVRSKRGSYSADKLIIAAGSWLPSLVPELKLPLKCERQCVFWFKPRGNAGVFSSARMPIYIWELRDRRIFYGFPDYGEGIKAARTHGGRVTSPDSVSRSTSSEDLRPVRSFLRGHLPGANGRMISSAVCLYTNTPDQDFVVDFHPRSRRVVLLSPCSGHGFKFASAIGELAAELVLEGKTRFDLNPFKVSRFRSTVRP